MSETYCYNYKGFCSIALLAICDSDYHFTLFDLGQYGSNNDCMMCLLIRQWGRWWKIANLVFNGDEIFPLKTWLMRSLPGKLGENQRIFYYRLSRARLTIESTFEILAARWIVFYTPISTSVENVKKYILARLELHNHLRLTDNATYCPFRFVHSFESSGKLKQREWRALNVDNRGLLPISLVKGSRYWEDAISMRNALIEYVNNEEGSVNCQKNTYLRHRTSNLFTLSFLTRSYTKRKMKQLNSLLKDFDNFFPGCLVLINIGHSKRNKL